MCSVFKFRVKLFVLCVIMSFRIVREMYSV